MPFESKFVSSPKGNLHILEKDGEEENPIFFIHGNSLCARAYLPFLETLHEKTRKKIIATDIRGHGLSTREGALPLKNWNLFVEDVILLVKNTLQTPVTAVGHSMGGVLLCMAAARMPHLFSRLILLDPIFLPPMQINLFRITQPLGLRNWFFLPRLTRKKRNRFPDRKSAADHYRGKGMFKDWPEECLEGFVQDGLRPLADGEFELSCTPELEARFFEIYPLSIWSDVKKIPCPVYTVRGEVSWFFKQKAADLLEKRLSHGHLTILKKGDHFFPLDSPQKSAKLVASFCES